MWLKVSDASDCQMDVITPSGDNWIWCHPSVYWFSSLKEGDERFSDGVFQRLASEAFVAFD
jgi:hypothetical protein